MVLTHNRVKPAKETGLNSIHARSDHTSKKEARRVLSVVTYLSRFSALMKKDALFIWEENEQKAFEEMNALYLVSNAPLLKYFNPIERESKYKLMSHRVAWGHASCKVVNPYSMLQ